MKIQNKLSVRARLLNGATLEKALENAFVQWATEDINNTHWREQFVEREWQYTGTTRRQNPSAPVRNAGDPRDIYDFGRLYESGVESFELSNFNGVIRASWTWEKYAWYVHEGAGTNKTPRPFTDDISIPSSFFDKKPGMAFLNRMHAAVREI